MARGDDRHLRTDDLAGRDHAADRDEPEPAGGDITGVHTQGGQVHVERDRAGDATRAEEAGGGPGAEAPERRALLDEGELDDFRRRWEEVQAGSSTG